MDAAIESEGPESGRESSGQGRVRICALALAGGIGFAPLLGATRNGMELLLWMSIWALPAGALGSGVRVLWALLVPAAWAAAIVALEGEAPASVAPLAPLGLAGFELVFALYGLGRLIALRLDPLRIAAGGVLLAGALAHAPTLGGLIGPAPWPAPTTALLLDLAPTSYVAEARGVDWMRDERIYDSAGTSSIGPDLRRPYRGSLAGWGLLLVGCASLSLARKARATYLDTQPWHRASSSAPSPSS